MVERPSILNIPRSLEIVLFPVNHQESGLRGVSGNAINANQIIGVSQTLFNSVFYDKCMCNLTNLTILLNVRSRFAYFVRTENFVLKVVKIN